MSRVKFSKYVLLFLIALSSVFFGKQEFRKGEILLIEKPRALVLLNKYKQRDDEYLQKLFPFEPAIIAGIDKTNPLQTLLAVKINGELFYLELDEKGELVRNQDYGKIIFLKNYKPLEKKPVLKTKVKARVYFFDKNKSETIEINPQTIDFIARKQNRYLAVYGSRTITVTLSRNLFEAASKNSSAKKLPENILSKIEIYFRNANKKLAQVFPVLNKKENKNLPTPRWEKRSAFKYELINGDAEKFPALTNYLLEKINLLLINEGFTAKRENQFIIISGN